MLLPVRQRLFWPLLFVFSRFNMLLPTLFLSATGAIMKTRSISVPFELRFNRPFVVSIIHRPSGLPLFLGRIEKPDLLVGSKEVVSGNEDEL